MDTSEFDYGKEVSSWRGFRFQNGFRELREAAEAIRRDGFTEIELDSEDELDDLFKDLEKFGLYRVKDEEFDYKAVDTVEHPDFFARIKFSNKRERTVLDEFKIFPIDIFIVPEEDDDYDEIGWG